MSLYKPYEKLVRIHIQGREFEVPEGNMLLRAMQFLAPEDVAMGRFCWNEECQYCRVDFELANGRKGKALACKLLVEEGMKVHGMAVDLRYCLRSLNLSSEELPTQEKPGKL